MPCPFTSKTWVSALYRDGFLLSEVPIGDGFLNIPEIVAIVRKQRPSTRLLLEMITRDPLEVPVFTDKYWATFPETKRLIPGAYDAFGSRQSNEAADAIGFTEGEATRA